jgi:hypothetical protein
VPWQQLEEPKSKVEEGTHGQLIWVEKDTDESVRQVDAPLRFRRGQRVICRMDAWKGGIVTRQYYTLPDGKIVPYQVVSSACNLRQPPLD